MNVELTIGSKTFLTTFFVIDGKGSYSLLLGHDWIHADNFISIVAVDPVYWELEDFECFSGKLWDGGFIKINDESQ